MAELWKIVCKKCDFITSLHLLVLLCELVFNARTSKSFLIFSLPIRNGPSRFVVCSILDDCVLDRFFYMTNLTFPGPISLLLQVDLSSIFVDLKTFSPSFVIIEISEQNFMWYGNGLISFDVITSLLSGYIVGVGRVRTVTRAPWCVTSLVERYYI